MKKVSAKPFLKWAGGKGQLLPQLTAYYPQCLLNNKIKRYIEPFVGGGAVFFDLVSRFTFEEVVLNDYNSDLILTYATIRDNPNELISELTKMENNYLSKSDERREKKFYSIREEYNAEKAIMNYDTFGNQWIPHAAKLIFLNKTCFNGLYRLNSKGFFNVPFGSYKRPNICDENNIRNVSAVLKSVKLVHGDFENLTKYIDEHSFVYMDPPYRPLSNSSSFTSYSKSPFNDDSQIRLAKWFKFLHEKKRALLMLSNADPKNVDKNDNFFDDLYSEFTINRVNATRAINSKGTGRGAIKEILVTNEHQLHSFADERIAR